MKQPGIQTVLVNFFCLTTFLGAAIDVGAHLGLVLWSATTCVICTRFHVMICRTGVTYTHGIVCTHVPTHRSIPCRSHRSLSVRSLLQRLLLHLSAKIPGTYYFPSCLLSSPFLSCSLLVVTQMRGHTAVVASSHPSFPTRVRALHCFITRRVQHFLPSSTGV